MQKLIQTYYIMQQQNFPYCFGEKPHKSANKKLVIFSLQKTLETDEITELAKYIDEDEYFTHALAMIGSGQIKRVPKAGGSAESVDSNQPLSTALFVYPDGMYSRTSIFSDTLSLVEFE